ncbi:neoA [Scenedesmus sp. PABB004]|nr:neoA [Scenedesmus sp. PABB004]
MQALVYTAATDSLRLVHDQPRPVPGEGEALVRVKRAGVCSTDLEITRGYVPGYDGVLGHEFVGIVVECASRPGLVGQRVVGEINCNDGGFACADAVFTRNHAPGRSVLGIIGRHGCLAEFCTLPARNLLVVPDCLSDAEAAFCEPLAAACRIVEQGLLLEQGRVAVLGDGRLGLLIAAVLADRAPGRVTHFGRHADKLALVPGTAARVVVGEGAGALEEHAGGFELVVEASGSAAGVRAALALTRPLGTLVLKTTVSALPSAARDAPTWAELANDIVVNEKTLVGSRCGPMGAALELMSGSAPLRALLARMVSHEVPLARGVEAMALAGGGGGCIKPHARPGRTRPPAETAPAAGGGAAAAAAQPAAAPPAPGPGSARRPGSRRLGGAAGNRQRGAGAGGKMVGFFAKWTFREPILMWTFYWTVAGMTVPFAVRALIERSRTPEVEHPPTVKEMIEAIKAQHGAAQQ